MMVSGKPTNNMVKESKLGMKVKVFTKEISWKGRRLERLDMNRMETFMKAISSRENFMEKESTILWILERLMKVDSKTMKCTVKEK